MYTVAETRGSLAARSITAANFLRDRWRRLLESNEQARDPAWISLASEAQLETQLAALEQHDPAHCPLFGVPFAVKDNIDVAGWTTTAACPEFAYMAGRSACVVEQLQQAGAVLLGKTNLDQFATGLVGTRSPFGAVPNVFSAKHISGGSSSGSASVVARGLVAFALGTDTAGSGRVPAGFNNIMGFKPTPGLISTRGVVPACRTLDCVSLFTLTAADAAIVVAAMVGHTAPDCLEPPFNRLTQSRYAFASRPRVGVLRNPIFSSEAYGNLYEASCQQLTAMDCVQGYFDFAPFAEVGSLLYGGPWVAERYSAVGSLLERGGFGIDPTVACIISSGKKHSAVDAFNAMYRVQDIEARTRKLWDEFDLLMVPSAPSLPTMADVAAQPKLRNDELGTYTNFVNLLGLSAFAVPFGFTTGGLPFGVTFIAPGANDWALIEFAIRWQQLLALPLGANLRALHAQDTCTLETPPGSTPLAVVGAHLSGMPLHSQLVEMGARLKMRTATAAKYRLYALDCVEPSKPGLVRSEVGAHIAVEVYDVPVDALGRFLTGIASPLGLGHVELQDGTWVTGFICEPCAIKDAQDITAYGGWRNYQAAIIGCKFVS